MKQAVIFDLDGTLWDSTDQITEAWNEVFALQNEPQMSKEEVMALMGLPMDEIAKRVYPNAEDPDAALKKCTDHENEYLAEHGGHLFEGLEETLKTLKKDYFLAIVSNCQSGYIEAFLKAHRFEKYFDDILCYGDTNLYKDENIRCLMEKNSIDEALYVGDIEGDYNSSVKAGIPFIFARYGFGQVQCPDAVDSLSELPAMVKQVFAKKD
ncbi:MAG: HAD family hydrolase [Ileibacterium sp.]|nr:HAD family hydrolase [Ileibacterium sp.]